MTFLELAQKRGSIRKYKPDPVNEADLACVLETGRWAPSACNYQPWRIIVVRDKRQREALADAYPRDWFWQAPVIIILCVLPNEAWSRMDGKNYADIDGAICMDHMTLCAAELGLGTCWIGAFNPAKLRDLLALPNDVEPLAMTPLGTPAAKGGDKKRKPTEELVCYERWQNR